MTNSSDVIQNPPPEAIGDAAVLSYETPQAPGIGGTAARGAVWMIGQTLASKLVVTAGQIVLAWILAPSDFGNVGLALTVWSLAMLVQLQGLQQILVRRFDEFDELASPALWMSLAFGLAAGLLMAGVAPIASHLFHSPASLGLMLVLATTCPLNAIATVPTAKLQAEMRFRGVSVILLWNSTLTIALTVALAYFGFGAYSFVIPRPVAALIQAAMLFLWGRPKIHWRLHLERWRSLFRDSGLLAGVSVCSTIITQGDYLTLGLLYDEKIVGFYFFAFNQSTQLVQLLAGNVGNVLLPSMAKLSDEPARMLDGFLRASRLLAVIGMPLCLMQAVAAEPIFKLLFQPKWEPSIPLFRVLCVAMAFQLAGISAGAMLQAQGRFAALLWSHVVFAGSFLIVVFFGAWFGAAFGTSIAILLHSAMMGPVGIWWSIRSIGGRWKHVARVFVAPFIASVIAAGGSWAASNFVAHANLTPHLPPRFDYVVQIVVVGIAILPLYLAVLFVIERPAVVELNGLLKIMLSRRLRSCRAS